MIVSLCTPYSQLSAIYSYTWADGSVRIGSVNGGTKLKEPTDLIKAQALIATSRPGSTLRNGDRLGGVNGVNQTD